jgi:putative MATE family efflux protein
MEKENKMGVMPIKKLVTTMSLPIMISMLVQSMYNIVDSIFVARISENALTATSIAYSAQMLQIAVAVGTGVGMNAIVSRHLGAKNYKVANEAATTGLFLTLLSSVIFILWGIFGTGAFIRLFTDDVNIMTQGITYLKICQLFSTGIFLGTFAQRLLQATGRTFSSMIAQMTGAVFNLIFDPLLIFGIGFFPEMGIAGAAVATVLGQWIAAIVGLILNKVQNNEIKFVFKNYKMNHETVKQIYKVGAPTILVQSFGSIMVAAMNMILVMFSNTAVAFFGVYFKLQSFLFMPMNGLGQGTLPIIGYNFGAKKLSRIKDACKVSITFGCIIGLIGTVIFLIFPKQLLLMFSASEEMLKIGIPALRIISITFALAACTMIIGYVISGLGNGFVNMIATAIRQIVVLLPIVILIGSISGISYVWIAFCISESCAFIYSILQLRKKISWVENCLSSD